MLALDDPLWEKLDTCHQDRNVPEVLSRLAETWDEEVAKSLLWDCLTHQETLYGATYAAVPYLLRIAESTTDRHQRDHIANFLGIVALDAFWRWKTLSRPAQYEPLQGLPQTLDGWERKRDTFRSIAASYERDRFLTDYQRTVLFRAKRYLATDPVNAGDLEKIDSMRVEFVLNLRAIRTLCERAFVEGLTDVQGASYRLGGIAAADGLFNLARLLTGGGKEGRVRCSSCGWAYEFIAFEDLLGDRWAIYANEHRDQIAYASSAMRDFRENRPSRADGFIDPAGLQEAFDPRATALLALAARAPSPKPKRMLCHLLGTFRCSRCGARGPILAL